MTLETSNLPRPGLEPASRAIRPLTFYAVVLIVFLADQVSKAWITSRLSLGGPSFPIFGDKFQLTLAHNTGGAWGLLPHGNLFFIVFAAGATAALLFAYHKMPHIELFVGGAFALSLGGALGNLLDRLRHGYVVDFFDARVINFPVFNVADSAITVGILLLLIHFLRAPRQDEGSRG